MRNNLSAMLGLLCGLVASGCTTTGPSFKAAEVIERIGGKGETPSWATGAVPMTEENGKVYFANTTNMGGDTRPDACMRVASETGRVEIYWRNLLSGESGPHSG